MWSPQQESYSEWGAEMGWVLLSSKIVADGPKKNQSSISDFMLHAPKRETSQK